MDLKGKALICPLDWGIGHATRCVPVIAKLKELGFGPKKVQESVNEDWAPENADEVSYILMEILDKLITVYGYEELEAKNLILISSNILEKLMQ